MKEKKKTICVIDGQGGGIGAVVINKLKERFEEKVLIFALGTNAIATAQMLKAKANQGASGTNAIVQTVGKADVIIGPVGIVMPHSMMGELTDEMAEAICQAPARKILLPVTRENIDIVGISNLPLPRLIDEMLDNHLSFLE